MTKETKPKKPWDLTQSDMASITDKELIYGTSRLLPPVDEIPQEFWKGNIYTRIAQAIYDGEAPVPGEITFLTGFSNDGVSLAHMSISHIRDMHADYDHRIAGVGYMISKVVHVKAIVSF